MSKPKQKKKPKKPSFILELKLSVSPFVKDVLNKRFRIGERLYNTTLSYALKQLTVMKESKRYRKNLHLYREVKHQLGRTQQKEKIKIYQEEKTILQKELSIIRESYGLTEYGLHVYIQKHQHNYKMHIDSLTAQKIATQVWQAMEKVIFHGSNAHFKKYGTLTSLEGKTNRSGIRFRDNHLVWNGLEIPVIIRKNDLFAHESLSSYKLKYCRIVRKWIRGKQIFYVQLIMDGIPPAKKINSTGTFRHPETPNERGGIDIGTSTIAVASKKEVFLQPLAPNVPLLEAEKRRLLRKLDRSRRSTNPQNYHVDGTIQKGIKLTWSRSKNYYKILYQLKEIARLKEVYVKEQHSKLANRILSCGNELYVETMNFKALAKRAKETKVNEKTGKFQRKKRYGKSIGNYAPAKLLRILKQKLGYMCKQLHEVNTRTFKASQYNHITDTCQKKKLHQRWSHVNGQPVQRDLYSAFLLMNSELHLEHTNRQSCFDTFEAFLLLHDQQIETLKQSHQKQPSSMGIQKTS